MSELEMIDRLRVLGGQQQEIEKQLEGLAQRRLILAGKVELLVELLGGESRVVELLKAGEPDVRSTSFGTLADEERTNA